MIVSVCLAKGALAMSRKKVIVKRLNSIQNFGAMDLLCTDKTGTLTEDRVVLQRHCNIAGRETDRSAARRIPYQPFSDGAQEPARHGHPAQFGFSPAILRREIQEADEIPFDFTRRMMSVLVENPRARRVLADQGRARGDFPSVLPFRAGWEVVAYGQAP